jgi:hypothetical protein
MVPLNRKWMQKNFRAGRLDWGFFAKSSANKTFCAVKIFIRDITAASKFLKTN